VEFVMIWLREEDAAETIKSGMGVLGEAITINCKIKAPFLPKPGKDGARMKRGSVKQRGETKNEVKKPDGVMMGAGGFPQRASFPHG